VGSVTDSQPTPETQAFSTVEDTGGELKHTLTKAEIPPHVHIETYRSNHNNGTNYGETGPYLYATQNTSDGSVDKAGNAQLLGQSHNNMQPYIVTYMWKRTA
jgi:microcystin-dependent protein